MKTIKLALIGYGNAGQAFARMLNEKSGYFEDEHDCNVRIVAICTASKGACIDPNGIDTSRNDLKFDKNKDSFDIIDDMDYDIMMELTPINIKTGQPAIDHIKHAFNRGKHVITANKGPIAHAYKELKGLADRNNVCFFHETTVMDGIPVFNFVHDTLKGCRILGVKGIFNSTSNYVLNELEKGVAYDDAVREGQRRGFVEADPSMDLEGWDATAKLTALMNVLMDAGLTPDKIDRTGISGITKEDIDRASNNSKKIKLLCQGKIENGKAVGTVKPQEIPKDSLFATINGTAAAITFTTDLVGDISVIQHEFEPEIDQTAYGILSDLIRVISNQ